MAKAILKGITVKIGGDTTDLIKSMDDAERTAKRFGNTAENLRKKLILKWDNATFKRAQEAAQQAVKETENRVDALKQALAEVEKSDTARAQKQITELKNQIEKAEIAAEQARKKLDQVNQVKLDYIVKQANDIGNAMLSMGAKLTVGLTTPIALGAKQAVETASDLAESQNVIEVAFGYSADKIDAWAKTLIDDFGLSELAAKKYAGSFMTLANSMGVANGDGMEMSKTLTELSSDMASFYNAEQDVAASALKGIFTGETESLKQFGVVMTDAALSAYALSEGIGTAYGKMSQSEKVMLRYQYVVDALSQAQGDFANTSDSLANQQRRLQAQLQTLAADLGKELLPIVEDVVEAVTNAVGAFAGMSDEQKKMAVTALSVLAAIGPVTTAFGAVNKVVAVGTNGFKLLKGAMDAARAATAAGTSATAAFTGALNANAAAQAAATAGLSLLVAALVAVAVKIATTDYNLEHFEGTVDNLNARMENIAQNGFAEASAELAKLDNVAENIIPRIEELANKTDRTAEETDELQALIPLLNEQLGYEAASFDAATGAVNMNTSAIYANIQAMRQRAVASAAAKEYEDLANQLYENKKERKELMGQLEENTKAYNEQTRMGLEASLGTILDREDLKDLLEQNSILDAELKKGMDTLARDYMMLGDAGSEAFDKIGDSMQQASGVDGMTREQREAAFAADREQLQYLRSINVIDQAEYRKNMNVLNQKYNLDDTEAYRQHFIEINNVAMAGEQQMTKTVRSGGGSRSSAVKAASKEQTAYVKQAYEQQVAAAKSAYEQQKALLKSNYDAAIKQIDAELKAKEAAINAEIAAINKQIEARRRAKQEGEYDTQINALQASIDYGGGKFDEFTLREMKAQLAQVEEDRADYRWELEQQDRIDALEQELEDARTLAEAQKEALQEMYEMHLEQLEEEYQLHLAQLDEIFKTADGEFKAISQEFVSAMQSGAAGAAATLRSAIDALMSANASLQLKQQQNVRAGGNTDNRTYSMTLNNAGYTDAQAARVFRSMMYE